jgi:protein ImuB
VALAHTTILPHDPAADLAALARLAEHCERFSPIVGWETAESFRFKVSGSKLKNRQSSTLNLEPGTSNFGFDGLFLDVTGIGVLFDGEENLARQTIADAARLGYEARAAIADTIGAAWAAARQNKCGMRSAECGIAESVRSTQCLVLSTESLRESQPTPGLSLHIPHSAFRTLPLELLRLPQETLDLLSQLGIAQLDQLLALPRESLRARFGERLLLRIDQLLGTAQEMIVPYRPPPQFISEWLLEYPAERRDVIEQIVRELIRRVASALAERREGVLKLACRLDCVPGRPLRLEVGLFRPSADVEHLWDLVRMQLEQAALSGAVGRVRLEATLTAPLENRQAGLFAGGEHEAARQLALLIDRCSSRLGNGAVLRPEFTSDPLPERAVRYRAGVGSQGIGGRKKFKVQGSKFKVRGKQNTTLNLELETLNSRLFRPLFLHSPPQPLEVLSVAPDGPPVSFRLQGRPHHVAQRWGPERIETGWWRGKSIRRDYWRVETDTGQRFWLFRGLIDGRWFLHGEFA